MRSLVEVVAERRAEEQARAPRHEVKCPGCGRRTTDKEGKCSMCRRAGAGFDLQRMTPGQLGALSKAIRVEVERRRKELEGL